MVATLVATSVDRRREKYGCGALYVSPVAGTEAAIALWVVMVFLCSLLRSYWTGILSPLIPAVFVLHQTPAGR
ncbi:MAG: hypothetical protein CMP07_12300 [Xanthomonadales bacterium]|nr:hypothetical protein [Xanthomonadales bacterium]